MPAKPRESTPVQVRLPADLHDELAAAAGRSDRSLNGQIVSTLRLGLAAEAQVDEQVAALMPVLGPRVAAAIRDQNAAEREKRKARAAH